MLTWLLSLLNLAALATSLLFAYESRREGALRALKIGMGAAGFHFLLGLAILFVPGIRIPAAWFFGILLFFSALLLIPPRKKARSLRGAAGYLAADGSAFERADERDVTFARNRCLIPGSKQYEAYYRLHPERKERDDLRREKGGPLGRPGSIDGGYRPNVSMLVSSFELPNMVGQKARVNPGSAGARSTYAQKGETQPPFSMEPEKATRIVKEWTRHLGADLVGICRVDPRWAYSHRGEIHYGEWDEWGRPVPEPLPYAVVVATAMDSDMVATAPHTPAVVESGYNYARGAYITTIMAQWFGSMGYRGVAEHNRHYDLLMVPLAVDAGLGELGRHGYLISHKYGPRVRLFAVQTDMPLVPDAPVDLGAEKFCERCLKCADSCPSRSIPRKRRKTVERGLSRWKLNEDGCFDYWGRVGTDCCVCMAVCPFSRPYRTVHKLVRWVLRRSALARILFPHVDNFIYGRKWRARKPKAWMAYDGS